MLEAGIPNLDLVLGGGIPEWNTLLVIGLPGLGKTTLSLQMAFHAAHQGPEGHLRLDSRRATHQADTPHAVLQLLRREPRMDRGEGTVELLAREAGQRRPELTRALDRLVTLGYALRRTADGQTVYRPAARALGE